MELPPRARRIHGDPAMTSFGRGTTSACAENTLRHADGVVAAGNYLRVRGEYHQKSPTRGPRGGTTSACAENTSAGRLGHS